VIEFIDHVAITVADVDRTIAFYERALGAELLHAEAWRAGQMPVALLQLGASRLSVHPAAAPASPHAARPTPGAVDICFRWAGPLGAAVDRLRAEEVEIEVGPVGRPASDGTRGESVYFRDPDDNLVELLSVTP
jgi:catechol 2,3-dioxygenase-like lactoylglutathione lyase family enzyme